MELTIHRSPTPYPEAEQRPRMGFFTDTSVCIGCKACEVACKQWNQVPSEDRGFTAASFDNSLELGANRWRHVAFIEQRRALGAEDAPAGSLVQEAAAQQIAGEHVPVHEDDGFRWLMSSDVCKHCTEAACLEVCPTGALFRTEFGTVVVQEDVCNGCGYCVPACPFGVIDRREEDGRAWKCTLCYDRLGSDLEPACAKACPTDSIQFGELEDLRTRAVERVEQLHGQGETAARLYGDSPDDGVGGFGAFFLLLDDPEVYGLPPDPLDSTRRLPEMYLAAAAAGASLVAGVIAALAGRPTARRTRGSTGASTRSRGRSRRAKAPTTRARSRR